MIFRVSLGTLLLVGGAGFAGELPVATPLERYQTMLDKSPFALATQAAPAAPAADDPGFAKDLIVTGAARLAQGEFVSIASRDQAQRFSLSTGESYNGISIASVTWADGVGKTKVTLKKGGEYGVIGFDEALIAAGAQGGKAPGEAPNPAGNVPPAPPNAIPGNTGRPPNPPPPRAPAQRRPRILTPPGPQ